MAKTTDAEERQMVHMRLEGALLERIDSCWHDNRFLNRSAAVRWLIQAALDKKLAPKAAGKKG